MVGFPGRRSAAAFCDGFCLSITGASHERSGKPCQDSSTILSGDGCFLAIVCDGHGGDDYFRSDRGSRMACDAAVKCLSDGDLIKALGALDALPEAEQERRFDALVSQLKKSIISLWNDMVGADHSAQPFSEEEMSAVGDSAKSRYAAGERIEAAYGTTMLAVVALKNSWFGLQIGDGLCAVCDVCGEFSYPMPEDERCYMNQTTSMCDSEVYMEMRHFRSKELPKAIFICTDGVENSFADRAMMSKLYSTALDSYGEKGLEDAKAELADFLPRLSQKGSGDDLSIAAIVYS